MLETEAYELIYDAETNAVKGVKARGNDGTEYTINAKAVVLATGGFIGSPEMQEKYLSNEYFPLKGVWKVLGWTGNDGKMIQSAIDIGAATYNIGMPPMIHVAGAPVLLNKFDVHKIDGEIDFWTSRTATWSLNDVPIIMTTAGNTLQLDTTGKRFSNKAGVFGWWTASPEFYTVWSDDQIKDIQENGFKVNVANAFIGQGGVPVNMPVPEIYDVLDYCISIGIVYKADTLGEAATVTGMDSDNLKNSVETYNNACAAGEDEEFGKNLAMLDAISGDGPYYVFKGASYAYSTCGGLDINTRLQVLDTRRRPHSRAVCGRYRLNGYTLQRTQCLCKLWRRSSGLVSHLRKSSR